MSEIPTPIIEQDKKSESFFDPSERDSYTKVVADFVTKLEAKLGIKMENTPDADEIHASQLSTYGGSAENLSLEYGVGGIHEIAEITKLGPYGLKQVDDWHVKGEQMYRREMKRYSAGIDLPEGQDYHLIIESEPIERPMIHNPTAEEWKDTWREPGPTDFPPGHRFELSPYKRFKLEVVIAKDKQGKIIAGRIEMDSHDFIAGDNPEEPNNNFLVLKNYENAGTIPDLSFRIEGDSTMAGYRDKARIREDKILDQLIEGRYGEKPGLFNAYVRKLTRGGLLGKGAETIRTKLEQYQQKRKASEVEEMLHSIIDFLPDKSKFKLTDIGIEARDAAQQKQAGDFETQPSS